jgi:hypothetical protein
VVFFLAAFRFVVFLAAFFFLAIRSSCEVRTNDPSGRWME